MRKLTLLRGTFTAIGILPLRWRLLPHGLYCVTFHRIGVADATEGNRSVFSCTATQFEACIQWLKERFELIGLEQVLALARGRKVTGKVPALVTFDDGYLDNYTVAFPILRRYQAPAAFFLPTKFIGTYTFPWWEELPWILRQVLGRTIQLAGARQPFHLNPADPERSIRQVVSFVKSRRLPMEEQLEEVREACGNPKPPAPAAMERLFMNWDEVRRMKAGGMDFGSHTHSHALLATLSQEQQLEELRLSKEILEEQLGAPVSAVAYPVGSATAYNTTTCEVAASLGYRLGFNFRRRTNPFPLRNPLDIGRLAISDKADLAGLRAALCFPRLFAE